MTGDAHMSRAVPDVGGNSCWTSISIFMTHLGGRGEERIAKLILWRQIPVGGASFVFSPNRPELVLGPPSILSNVYRGFCLGFEASGVQNYLSLLSSPKLRISGCVALCLHSHTHLHDVPKWLKVVATVSKYTEKSISNGMPQDPKYVPFCTGFHFIKMLKHL
jgi:hypothetical protein